MEGVECGLFAMDEIMNNVGREEMNKRLIHQVQEEQYDLLFCFLFTEELKKETIDYITRKTRTKTFNWFADDHWRLPIFSRFWAPVFTMVGTTDSQAIDKYKKFGIHNVIKTQWGVNHHMYQASSIKYQVLGKSQIAFVGKKYGNRGRYVEALISAGLNAEGYGQGWKKGRVSFEKMIEIFSSSKINLNFAESPYVAAKERFKFFVKGLLHPHQVSGYMESYKGAQRKQIKGRTFEIPACGGFLLTNNADNLRDYYIDGKEIVIFENKNDLAEKCKYYLSHEAERRAIAAAGYQRTIKEHTYAHRFREIFKALEFF